MLTFTAQRGQAENLIKLHKAQLASDRTSCRAATANQMRLVLHTAAYWLVLAVREAIPKAHALAKAEFATIRLRLLKIAARVTESASRVRLAFAAACPDAVPVPPDRRRRSGPHQAETPGPRRPDEPIPPLQREPNYPITPRRPPAKRSHDRDQARHHRPGHGE